MSLECNQLRSSLQQMDEYHPGIPSGTPAPHLCSLSGLGRWRLSVDIPTAVPFASLVLSASLVLPALLL